MLPNLSPQLSARLDTANRTIYILWLALTASICVYGGVVFMIASTADGQATPLPLPPFLFPMLAFMQAIAGMVMYRHMTGPDRVRAVLNEPPATDPQLSEAEQRLSRVPGLIFTASIIRWALFESVAVLGLVLGITERSFQAFVPYGVTALALMAMTPPKLRQVTESALPLMPP